MKYLKIIIALIFFSGSIYAQKVNRFNPNDQKSYKPCVKEFYRLLFSNKKVTVKDFYRVYSFDDPKYEAGLFIKRNFKGHINDFIQLQQSIATHNDTLRSHVLLEVRAYKKQLTQGLSYYQICKLVDSSQLSDDGWEFAKHLEVKFPNGAEVFFEMNKDTPKQILYIWLPDGKSLNSILQGIKVEKFQRPGIINDPDGYTNIREKPDKSARIIGRFVKNEIFYYTPTNQSNWWPVYKKNAGPQVGYIYKNRILTYPHFPSKLKEIVKKARDY